jgi:hypothetical protein
MCRRLLVLNLRLLIASSATILVILPVYRFAQASEATARHWKIPVFVAVTACVFAMAFATTFRKVRPRLEWRRSVDYDNALH